MPTDFAFRFSTYLTLALGCSCLGYAEWDYLPEVSIFTLVIIALLVFAFVAEGRGYSLNLKAANKLGAVIGVIAIIWLVVHYRQPESLMHTLPWPAGGLPYLAPLLIVLIPAKLFRPKHAGDWWALHGAGLCSVGLAGSLTEDESFAIPVALYVLVAVWSLTLFYLRRSAGYIVPVRVAAVRPALAAVFSGLGTPSPIERLGRSHLRRALHWVIVAAVVSLPFFFLTPRSNGYQWELFNQARLQTGLSGTDTPDLSRTGQLKPSRDVAFYVSAHTPDGQAKLDLPADQRWRGPAYSIYESPRGRWSKLTTTRALNKPTNWKPSTTPLPFPNLGPDAFILDFQSPALPSMAVYADPVVFRPGEPPPIIQNYTNGYAYAAQNWDTSFTLRQREYRTTRFHNYSQVTVGPRADGSEPVSAFTLNIDPNDVTGGAILVPFRTAPPWRIAEYASTLLGRLIGNGRLADLRPRLNPFTNQPAASDHEAVAKAFRDYLALSGDFSYTLTLRRQDKTVDPIEDFLVNVKSGHCERFASALVLMLRGVGIPAQLVMGYKGCEHFGTGQYVVRQEEAHAWTEVLLSRPAADGTREWYWLNLDPTPGGGGPDPDADDGLISTSRRQTRQLFADYVIGLTPETQRKLASDAGAFADDYLVRLLAAAGVIGVAILFTRYWRHRSKTRREAAGTTVAEQDPVPWYTRMVDALAAHGLPRLAEETPRDFAVRAQQHLLADECTREVADVPRFVTAAHEDYRYAHRELSADRQSRVLREIERLSAAFARRRANA